MSRGEYPATQLAYGYKEPSVQYGGFMKLALIQGQQYGLFQCQPLAVAKATLVLYPTS